MFERSFWYNAQGYFLIQIPNNCDDFRFYRYSFYCKLKRCARTWAARDAELARTSFCPDAVTSVVLAGSGVGKRSFVRKSAAKFEG